MAIGGSGIESVLGGRADALAMNPRAQQEAMQKGRQDVRRGEVPGNLLDLLAMQKLADDKQRAKAEMDASMQGNPATIKDQLEQQLMQSTKEDVAKQVGGALNQQAAQAQKRMSQIANQPAPAPNLLAGVARAPAPNMARMAGGGIVAFAEGDLVEDQGPEDAYGSPVIEAFMEDLRRENPRAFGNIDYERAADIYAQRFGRRTEPVRGIARMAAERKQRQEEALRREQARPRAAAYMDPYAGSEGILGVVGQAGPQLAPMGAKPDPFAAGTMPEFQQPKMNLPALGAGNVDPAKAADLLQQRKDLRGIATTARARDPYEEARKRAELANELTGRQGIMDLARQGREARAAAVARQKAETPSLAWTARVPGIGGLAALNRAMSAERAAQNAAELANLDKDLLARQKEAEIGAGLGKEASAAAREGMLDIEAGRRQAESTLTQMYGADSKAAQAEADRLFNRDVATLEAADRALRRATDVAIAQYNGEFKVYAERIAASAKIMAEKIEAETDRRKRAVDAQIAIEKIISDNRENAEEQIQNLTITYPGMSEKDRAAKAADIRKATEAAADAQVARIKAAVTGGDVAAAAKTVKEIK